jgi:hypothetical protein
MPDHPVHSDPPGEPELPAALAEALGGLHPRPAVAPEIDRALLAEARAGFLRRRRFWLAARAVGATAAAAAAIVLAVVAVRERRQAAPVAATQGAAVVGDLDGSGRVDVLDAFLLARRVRDGTSTRADDVTGDGVVDQSDVDRVAGMAVSVGDGGKGGLR